MDHESRMEEQVQRIFDSRGRRAAEEFRKTLLEDIESEELNPPLRYLAEHWRDQLRPSLISLSCELVGGKPEETIPAATAMTLLCSCMQVYDDLIDGSKTKRFVPTLPGKFGEGIALIVGGLVTAKAFSILYEETKSEAPPETYLSVYKLFQDFLLKMSEAEAKDLRLRRRSDISVKEKLDILVMESADIEACMKIGAAIGGGSSYEIEHLGSFGVSLGTALRLQEDLIDALNLTVELTDKIAMGILPYTMIWAMDRSEGARNLFSRFTETERVEPCMVRKIVETMFESGAVNHVEETLNELSEEAGDMLKNFEDCPARNCLEILAHAQSYPTFKKFLRPNP